MIHKKFCEEKRKLEIENRDDDGCVRIILKIENWK